MIKRNILALFFPFLLIINAVNAAEDSDKNGNKIDLYGKTVGLHYFSKGNVYDSNQSYAILGFKGETQINDQLVGYGRWEYSFAGNNFEDGPNTQIGNKTCLAYAGLKTIDYGSLDYGRNYGIVHDALSYTSVLPEFGSTTSHSDNFFMGRIGNVATYRNPNFFGLIHGLNFGIQYLGKNDRTIKHVVDVDMLDKLGDVRRSNGTGWGTSLNYKFDDFSVVGAYGIANRINPKQNFYLHGNGNKAEQWITGLKYDAKNVYLAGNYGETHNATLIKDGFANKTRDVLLVAKYQFDFGLRPSISYIRSKAKNIEGIGCEDLVKYIGIGATYFFNDQISTFIDYKINQINDNNKLSINSEDNVSLGILYRF